MMTWSFRPASATVNVTGAVTSANVALPAGSYRQVRIVNDGTITAFIEFGKTSAIAATLTTSFPLRGGAEEVFTPPADTTYVAAITPSSTSAIYITGGEGV